MRTNLLMAIGLGKCPRCRQGSIFKHSLFNIIRMGEMNASCKKCGITFEPEPGFYFGALYVSYAFTTALFLGVSLGLYYFFDPPEWVYIISIIIASVLFIPFSFRYSRILFLYWFGGLQNHE
ncbi:MAG: DUF983 domain-containing protein [Bacteroidetes bacterium]|nr:DUF983 domain-containing protein [Bacteroidota bacterium]